LRALACARCGVEFKCTLSKDCWCGEEMARLPLPTFGTGFADCLCRDCLRAVAVLASLERHTISAVLLDMDGTLLDTERVYRTSLCSALADLGYGDGTAIAHAMIGIPAAECEIMLRDHYGVGFRIEDVRAAYEVHRDGMLRDGMPLKPGTLELVAALREFDCPAAIVTSSTRRNAEQHLALAGIRHHFDTVLTRDDVAQGKPSPDLYLLAAQRLGFAPKVCLAVEDSRPGIEAAHHAGAIPIMVPDIVPPTEATRAKCAAVLPDLHAVLTMLRDKGAFDASRRRN
jgi:HAD superfamily hydrolase (TIGR01509 family)